LIADIALSVERIALGRKCFTTAGRGEEGRLFYEDGITRARNAFQAVKVAADPQTFMLAELVFSEQELYFCDHADKDVKSSLTKAIQSFRDAFRTLEAVVDIPGYKTAEKTYPIDSDYRVQGYPKDGYHIAAIAHQTRLRNVLRAPGINMTEKAVLNQRIANMKTAQTSYVKLQQAALAGERGEMID
jgi:hypothetical protein